MADLLKLLPIALVFAPAVTEYVVNATAARSGLPTQVSAPHDAYGDCQMAVDLNAGPLESRVRYPAAGVRVHFMPAHAVFSLQKGTRDHGLCRTFPGANAAPSIEGNGMFAEKSRPVRAAMGQWPSPSPSCCVR